jgi:hypothetical protein
MKTNPTMFAGAALMLGAVLWGGLALSQPAQGQRTNLATGLPAGKPEDLTPDAAHKVALDTEREVWGLVYYGRYEQALQRCLAFRKQFKSDKEFLGLLRTWVQLGKKYPKARAALVEIRNGDVRECLEGRGYWALFREVSSINSALQQEDKTYELFNSLREKDPGLAQQCYSLAEGMLVAKGEYQWCYDHMGEPQDRLDSFRKDMVNELTRLEFIKRAEESRKQRGLTNAPGILRPEGPARVKKSAEDKFVGQTRQLIEILVATNHQPEAEKIRDQAVAILDDARLKSAVTDAMNHTRK